MSLIVAFLAVLLKPIDLGDELLLVKRDQEFSKNNKKQGAGMRNGVSCLCAKGRLCVDGTAGL
jgi:hypothetical protein